MDFSIVVAGVSADLPLQILNVTTDDNGGTSALTDLTLDYTITGDDAALFGIDLSPLSVVAKGGTLLLNVTFLGSSIEGYYDATLTILTDEGAALGQTSVGQSYSYNLSVQVIPEPATGLLMLLMLFGGIAPRRRALTP